MRERFESGSRIHDNILPEDIKLFISVGARDSAFRTDSGLWIYSDDGSARQFVYPPRQVTLLPIETIGIYDDSSPASEITQVPVFRDYNYENAEEPFRYIATQRALTNGTLTEEKVVNKENELNPIWTYSHRERFTKEGSGLKEYVSEILDFARHQEFSYDSLMGNDLGAEYYEGDTLAWKYQAKGTHADPMSWKDTEYVYYKNIPVYIGVGVGRFNPEEYAKSGG